MQGYQQIVGVQKANKMTWGFISVILFLGSLSMFGELIETGLFNFGSAVFLFLFALLTLWGISRNLFSSLRIENNQFIYKNMLGDRIIIPLDDIATFGNVTYKSKYGSGFIPQRTQSMEFILKNGEKKKVAFGHFKNNEKAELIHYMVNYVGEKNIDTMLTSFSN